MASTFMIKRLWNDRRGVSAWAVTVAMVPLLGMVSLGTELGSWYAIRRNAQNAADSAAIAGATALAINDPNGAVTAGQAFANSNGFATGGGCPSTATTGQNVCITSLGTGGKDTKVTAVVTQYETPIFTQWFLPKDSSGKVNSVKIQATAVATIQQQKTGGGYCALARTNLDISGNAIFYGGCGLASNGTLNPPPAGQNPFSVPPGGQNTWTVRAAGNCTGNANKCNLDGEVAAYNYSTNSPVPLPPALVNLMANADHIPTEPKKPGNVSGTPSPSTTTWQGNYTVPNNSTVDLIPGVYMFDSLTVNGTLQCSTCTSTGTGVNIIIGSGGLSGNGTMSLTAGTGGGFPNMNGVLIYDMENNSGPPNFTGQFTGNINGALYFPNASLTFRGGSNLGNGCTVLVANKLSFGGNSSMDTSGCSPSFLQNDVAQANVVILTQ
jgi:Flp pilus assembly protein TadG